MSISFWYAVLALSLLFCCFEFSEGNSEQKTRVKFTQILNVFCAEHFYFPVITTAVCEQTLYCGLCAKTVHAFHAQPYTSRYKEHALPQDCSTYWARGRNSQLSDPRDTWGTGGQLSCLWNKGCAFCYSSPLISYHILNKYWVSKPSLRQISRRFQYELCISPTELLMYFEIGFYHCF